MKRISTSVKTAFTRQYNKQPHDTPFTMQNLVSKSRAGKGSSGDLTLPGMDDEDDAGPDSDQGDEDDMSDDKMIQAKPDKNTRKRSAPSTQSSSASLKSTGGATKKVRK